MDIEELYDKIYRYCYFKLYDTQIAQDITQEAFLRFYRRGLNFDNGRELPYLYTIAKNLCIDEFRKQTVDSIEDFESEATSDPSEEWIDALVLRSIVSKLPNDEQELLFLRYENELPITSICKITGLRQLNDAYQFIDQFNHTHAHTEGLYRIDKRAYPTEAIREALLNAIVHREYSFSASTLISIFDNRIEFVSIGGLARGISQSDILLGISIARNKKLADVFYRLHLIEAYGTGMPKIMEAYKEYAIEPHIEISDNAFKITLPNTNTTVKEVKLEFTENEQGVLSVLKEGIKSRPEIQKALGFSQTTTIVTIAALIDKGLIVKVGNGNKTKYKVV